ncbi:MAG: hypothetical protein JWR39_1088 [Devosia sp.]|nr:hypothetical protein [Devosia sp.]
MSGIAGLVKAGDHTPHSELATHHPQAMRHRGPDGLQHWGRGRAFLSHAHRDTTGFLENNFGRAEGDLIGLGDIRLDNRAELAQQLGADAHTDSDIDLVALAYRRWGPDCCTHLIGDFAFALWDEPAQSLFCARDHWGVKPLFYAHCHDSFSFSSEPAALVCGRELDDGRIASFIAGFIADPDATAYARIKRLLPGHWLLFKDQQLVTRRYWSAELSPDASRPPALAVQALLREAVRVRLRGSASIGAMLSGGLDSSSIVATAATLAPSGSLHTFSFDYPGTPKLSERQYVDAVLAAYPLQPSFVPFDDLAPLQGLTELADPQADLLFAPGTGKMLRLFKTAQGSGTEVLLDGHGGDEVISQGYGRLSELARAGQWHALHRELRGMSGTFGDNPHTVFLRYFAAFGPARRLTRKVQGLWAALRPAAPVAREVTTYVATDLARRYSIIDRHAEWRHALRAAHADEQSLHLWNVSSPGVGQAFEALDRASTLAGIELRFPFFDHRLVSYALTLPSSEILCDGWSRSVLRRAMQDILPPKVQWRRDKIDFGPELRLGLVKHHGKELDALSTDRWGVSAYVHMNHMRQAVGRLRDNPMGLGAGELFVIWRALFLSLWLQNRAGVQ